MRGCAVFLAFFWPLLAQAAGEAELFRDVIQPVLRKDCQGCHGETQTLAKLDLRTRASLLKGGQSGPAIVPGNAAASLLFRAIDGRGEFQMPPGGPSKRLPAEVIEAVRRWIDSGSPWVEGTGLAGWGNYKDEDVWAFRPLRRDFAHSSIDGFLNAALTRKGLRPSGEADRRTLIRRVTFDLTGLPPSPGDVEKFVTDTSPDAWPKLVDRLLSSPGYGERSARHWLDVTRYADTSGYSNDFERPNAWRYRDYIIRSFNQNKPYDRFVQEQIAGDEIFPGDAEALIATGFLRMGPWEHTGMSVEAVTRQMFLDDATHNTAAVFLGVTLGCARCHDHKFDPIPTKDYYRMQAVFAPAEFARPKLPFLAAENTSGLERGRARLQEIVRRTQEHMDRMKELVTQRVLARHKAARAEDLPEGVLADAIKNLKELSPAEFEEHKLYQKHLQLYRESLDRYEAKAFAVSSGPRDGETDGGPNLRYPKRADYRAPQMHVLPGGNIQSPAEAVEPGVLGLVERYGGLPAPVIPQTVEGRRAALARWITDPRHPLTARVMVNRVWQYHFGRGLAADANNFGKMGRKPSHPELLDWLAARFVASGWDVKALHRMVLLSDAYRRSGEHATIREVREKDPDNALLAYFPPRRLEAEEFRDAILAVAGELSLEGGGPGVFPQINADVARQPRHAMGSLQPLYHESARKADRNRRTIYTFQQRSLADPMIEVFNGAGMDLSCERRDASTVPTQSFALLNSDFANDMALAFAARVAREAGEPSRQLARGFELAYGRPPEDGELRTAQAHYEKMAEHHRRVPPPGKPQPKPVIHMITSELTGEQHRFEQQPDVVPHEPNLHASEASAETRALADVALALLNSNEFVYVY